MGVHTRYIDGLGKRVIVAPETLVRVCAALGAPIERPADAADALRAHRAGPKQPAPAARARRVGWSRCHRSSRGRRRHAEVHCADGDVVRLDTAGAELRRLARFRRLSPAHARSGGTSGDLHRDCRSGADHGGGPAPTGAGASGPTSPRSARPAAGRWATSGTWRSFCRWVRERGGDLVTVLPLLPTFNTEPPEPSPYSPVSRLFWSELMLDLEDAHRPAAASGQLWT